MESYAGCRARGVVDFRPEQYHCFIKLHRLEADTFSKGRFVCVRWMPWTPRSMTWTLERLMLWYARVFTSAEWNQIIRASEWTRAGWEIWVTSELWMAHYSERMCLLDLMNPCGVWIQRPGGGRAADLFRQAAIELRDPRLYSGY
jgi:hypothetical protein